MASNLLSFAGWYFLPNFVSGHLQTAIYAIVQRAGDPKPAPGTLRYVRDRRRIQIAVILAYLLYTLYEADYQLSKDIDFYRLLGVPHDVTEKAVLTRFRRLTLVAHPDKAKGPDKPALEAFYIQLQLARDILSDPVKRFAYDRFGNEMLAWQQRSKTLPDYVLAGLQNAGIYYLGSALGLVLLSLLGYLKQGMFWRYLVMAGLFVFELYIATRPAFPAVLSKVVNPLLVATRLHAPYLPFQMLTLLRKCAVTFFIALSQLAPLLQDPPQPKPVDDEAGVSAQQLARLDLLAQATDQEVMRLMGLELMPFTGDATSARELKMSVKEWLVQNTVRSDPGVKAAVQQVLVRRRQEGGVGYEANATPDVR